MEDSLVLPLQPWFQVICYEDAGKQMKTHRRQREDDEGNDQFGFKIDAENMLFALIDQFKQVTGNQVKYDRQQDDVDVDGNEKDQPGLTFLETCKTLLDIENDQDTQQSQQNQKSKIFSVRKF